MSGRELPSIKKAARFIMPLLLLIAVCQLAACAAGTMGVPEDSGESWLAVVFTFLFVFAVLVAMTLAFYQMAAVIMNEFSTVELHDFLAAFRGRR